jgi:hypothetical protein
MVDMLKARLEKLQKSSESAKRRAGLYTDMAKMNNGPNTSSLGALQKASAPGKKLQKIGFMMLWVPEPTGVTCAVGAPLIVAGRYLDKKYNGATIHDIGHETKHVFSSIHDFKNSII